MYKNKNKNKNKTKPFIYKDLVSQIWPMGYSLLIPALNQKKCLQFIFHWQEPITCPDLMEGIRGMQFVCVLKKTIWLASSQSLKCHISGLESSLIFLKHEHAMIQSILGQCQEYSSKKHHLTCFLSGDSLRWF